MKPLKIDFSKIEKMTLGEIHDKINKLEISTKELKITIAEFELHIYAYLEMKKEKLDELRLQDHELSMLILHLSGSAMKRGYNL